MDCPCEKYLVVMRLHTCPQVEADTVAHCGPTFQGEFTRTLTMTDLVTGWTENASIRNNASKWIIMAVAALEERFPFPLVVFDSDNGS